MYSSQVRATGSRFTWAHVQTGPSFNIDWHQRTLWFTHGLISNFHTIAFGGSHVTGPTLLDHKHDAMQSGGFAEQLSFYQTLTDTALILWVEEHEDADKIVPKVVELDGGNFVMAFDLDERLADMSGGVAETATLPGRALTRMLQGQGLGIALNLGDAPSAMLLPPDAIDWIIDMLDQSASSKTQRSERPVAFGLPTDIPETLAAALSEKLILTGARAYLTKATYANRASGHMVVFVDVPDADQSAIADAVSEALTFSALEAGTLDVAFFTHEDARLSALAQNAYKLDPPKPQKASQPSAPGMNPDRPPILK